MFEMWKPEYISPVLAFSLLTIGYIGYFFVSHSNRIYRSLVIRFGEERSKPRWFFFQKLTGFVFLGLIPFLVFMIVHPLHLSEIGMNFRNIGESLLWIIGLSAIIIVINFFAARNPGNLESYPQIRVKKWTYALLVVSSSGWILYLLGYEFLFRGILLFSCLPLFGVWPSIAINVAFYALVHIPKGFKETAASIPLGIILCILTIMTGSIWVAYLTHVSLALSNDFFSIYYHPDMYLKRSIN